MSKVRHIDYVPDEYISGVGGVLRADEQGVYWMICSLIMSEGGAIREDHFRIAGLCKIRPSDAKKIIERLVTEHHKLARSDGKLCQKRAQSEVEKASKRIQTASENGAKGGRPSSKGEKNQQGSKATGLSAAKLTTNDKPLTTNSSGSEEPSEDLSSDFDLWYAAYPRHEGRGQAERAYRAARKKADADALLAGAKAAAGRYSGSEKRFIPMPATWLNGERWLDDPADEQGGGKGSHHDEWDDFYRGVDYGLTPEEIARAKEMNLS